MTSDSAAKQRYNLKTYTEVRAAIPKALAAEFAEKCKNKDVSKASVIRAAIEKFIAE